MNRRIFVIPPFKHLTSVVDMFEEVHFEFCLSSPILAMPDNFSCKDKANFPTKCLAGTFASAGSIQCHSCPKRAHCPTDGLSTYVLCANGTYSDMEGQSGCKLCDAGFRCPSVGMESPQVCPNGTYSNATGSRDCVLCPAGHR